jgi:hypothetical protein
MTLIGAIECGMGVVLCADRQETIADYAKWDCCKITQFEMQGVHRVFMAGSGDSDLIDATSDLFKDRWTNMSSGATAAVKEEIIKIVAEITTQSVMPYPKDERPQAEIIWAIQPTNPGGPIELFRTRNFSVNGIKRYHFTGNPILLAHYLSDMYLSPHIYTVPEAEAMAAYILWECKEYDPTVGKHSDIVSLGWDGSMRRMTRVEEGYWEEHFFELKKAIQLLPILSCSDKVLSAVYDPADRLARFKVTLDTLSRAQKRIRDGTYKTRTLGNVIHEKVKRDYERRQKRKKQLVTPSDSQKSEDHK